MEITLELKTNNKHIHGFDFDLLKNHSNVTPCKCQEIFNGDCQTLRKIWCTYHVQGVFFDWSPLNLAKSQD